jgi:hypothetical protein
MTPATRLRHIAAALSRKHLTGLAEELRQIAAEIEGERAVLRPREWVELRVTEIERTPQNPA